MRKIILFGMALFLAIPPALEASGAEEKLPAIILNGLNAYKKSGPEAAIKVWIKGSPMEKKNKKDAIVQYAKSFTAIEEFYGSYLSYHLIEAKEITPLSKLIILSMDLERGPVFAKFLAYKGGKHWILVSFDFNTKPEVILPALLLDRD